MPNKNKIQWTKDMYGYLAWRLFELMYGATEWCQEEEQRIKTQAAEARDKLDTFSRQVVDNRARRLSNDYHENALHSLGKMYWHELNDEDDGYLPAPIDYDEHYYAIWSKAVRQRLTVKMTYDSTSSGVSKRLVDPYWTRAPYGDAFCHKRKEVRKFRFDRIIDITLTGQKFEKPKNWKEMIK